MHVRGARAHTHTHTHTHTTRHAHTQASWVTCKCTWDEMVTKRSFSHVTSRGTLHSSRMKSTNGQLLAAHAAWRAVCAAKASELVRDVCGLGGVPREVTSQTEQYVHVLSQLLMQDATSRSSSSDTRC